MTLINYFDPSALRFNAQNERIRKGIIFYDVSHAFSVVVIIDVG